MRITEKNDSKLIIKHHPLITWFFGSFFVAAGLGTLILFSDVASLNCQRSGERQGQCRLVQSGLLDYRVKEFSLSSLQRAVVFEEKNGRKTNYQVVLVQQEGNIPFTQRARSDFTQAEFFANQINSFLTNSNKEKLELQQKRNWRNYIWGAGLSLLGLSVALGIGRVITVRFDKAENLMVVTRRSIISQRVYQYKLEDVVEVAVVIQPGNEGKTYGFALRLNSGEYVFPDLSYSSKKEAKVEIAKTIADFLNKDYIEKKDNESLSLVRVAQLQERLRRSPSSSQAYYALGRTFFQLERYEEAVNCLEKAKELFLAEGKNRQVKKTEKILDKMASQV